MEELTLHLPNDRHVRYGRGDIASLGGADSDGLIIEGAWGFNDLGGFYGGVISPLLGVDTGLVRRLCDDNNDQNEHVTLIALPSTVRESSLKAVVFVPTELGRPYQRLATPIFGKPHRDFYYNVVYEALGLLAEFGCTGIAIAGLRGFPQGHKDIDHCVAEAVAHFALEHLTLRRVVTVSSGPDLSNGIRFFNEHPESIGRHREVTRLAWTEDQVTRLRIDMPHREELGS